MTVPQAAALLVVMGYVAFEVTALARARDRMEPEGIYRGLVAARTAVETCGPVPDASPAGFQIRLDGMRERLRQALAESGAAPDPVGIEARIAASTREAEAETSATLDAEGCDGFTARRLLRRYEMEAGR